MAKKEDRREATCTAFTAREAARRWKTRLLPDVRAIPRNRVTLLTAVYRFFAQREDDK
jgi:hypothetical protein